MLHQSLVSAQRIEEEQFRQVVPTMYNAKTSREQKPVARELHDISTSQRVMFEEQSEVNRLRVGFQTRQRPGAVHPVRPAATERMYRPFLQESVLGWCSAPFRKSSLSLPALP